MAERKVESQKCQFDFQPLKIRNHPELDVFRGHATYCWKTFDEGYKFALNLTSIKGLKKKLWTSKVVKV